MEVAAAAVVSGRESGRFAQVAYQAQTYLT